MKAKFWNRLGDWVGVLASIGQAWDFFEDILDQCSRIFLGEMIISQYNLINAMEIFISMELPTIQTGSNQYMAYYCENKQFRGYVPAEVVGNRFKIYFYHRIPILIKIVEDDNGDRSVICRYPRLLINPEDIVSEAVNYFNKQTAASRFFIKIESRDDANSNRAVACEGEESVKTFKRIYNDYVDYIPDDIDIDAPVPFNMEDLCLTNDLLDAVKEMGMWLDSREWYQNKKIPWRRGWLLHGKPGTGKTTFMVSLAKHFGLPIVIFDLSTLNNFELRNRWNNLSEITPCVVLLEDLDGVFRGRENIVKNRHSNVTFDCLLNVIAGAGSAEGIFLAVTTNHPATLDPALGRVCGGNVELRPGRIDRAIEFSKMNDKMRRKMAFNILGEYPEQAKEVLKKHRNVTVAEFQEACVLEAIKLYWENRKSNPVED